MQKTPDTLSAAPGLVTEVTYAPRGQFLALLLDGWRLPFVVEPMQGHHGHHSILMERDTP
ncbi:MAG: hypothetical protein CMM61_13515 [Rhodospirillaceae bacterium]|nr:hypothetical protein [Rhodospirillaceae bacterium]